ncbi:MAG: hypothetical protein KGH58_03115 [Candidatus Micrarchaeota archaeon]|nr:hypothetical protein [Candidatus Micrarchaeota archaeon]
MALQKKVDKWKMKQWFSVYAPKVFNESVVGEMPANDEKAAMGRNIVISLDTLTKNPSHAYTNVVLKVENVQGTSARTRLVALEQLYSYTRSLVRRYRSIATSVIPVTTKDGIRMVVKMIAVTRRRTAHSKILGVRKEMNQLVEAYAKENDAAPMISAIIDGKFQAELSAKLDHITDLNKIEVRKLEIKGA